MKILKRDSWAIGLAAAVVILLGGCGGGGGTSYDLGAGTGGTGLTHTFSSPAEMGVGDIMPIEFEESSSVTVDFAGVDTSERFILVVGNAKQGGSGSTIQLSTSESVPAEDASKSVDIPEMTDDDNMDADAILSSWMRAFEFDLAANAEHTVSPNTSKAMEIDPAVSVGSTREFRMLNSLSSSVSYTTATGVVKCIGANVVVYVDSRVTTELTDEEIDTVCANVDKDIGEEQSIYGALSDVDGDGKLSIFMSMQVNMLGGMGGGIVTGYFYAGDLYPRSGSNPVSNNGEIIYTLVPDPSGRWGVALTHEFATQNLIPAVLVHEAQHAISYNQHVFVNGGSPEEPWLNEALSHFTEDLMGWGRENPSRIAMFLNASSSAGLITQSTPNLLERGASYLFMRFMYEQHPDGGAFLAALENTALTGVENLVNAFGGSGDFQSFSQFMARWAVTLAMTNRGLTTDVRYIYRERVRDSETNNWQGVCLICDAEDGRGTTLEGVKLSPYYGYHTVDLDSSALKYFEISTIPEKMILDGSADNADFGVLIRTQ